MRHSKKLYGFYSAQIPQNDLKFYRFAQIEKKIIKNILFIYSIKTIF